MSKGRKMSLPLAGRVREGVAIITAVLVLAACGGAGNGGEGSVSANRNDINPQSRSNLAQGGTLNLRTDQYSSQWNTFETDGPEAYTAEVVGTMLPGLFNSRADGTVYPDPNYLTSASASRVGGKQVVTYELNPKAHWTDGRPIDESDFAAQWKALNGTNQAYSVATTTGYDKIENVTQGKNSHEIVVTFKAPFSDWQSLFGPLYPASANSSPDAFNTGWLNKMGPTAGPFKLESLDPGAKIVTVVRDPNWWGTPAILDKIVFRTLDQTALPGAFASGEIDAFDIGADAAAYHRALGVPNSSVRKAGGPTYRVIRLNGRSQYLSDLHVRQAVAEAINRQAVIGADLAGVDWPVKTLGNHFFMNNQKGYQDNSGQIGRFNPTNAKKLLDDAGWKVHGTYRQKDGNTLSLNVVIPAGLPAAVNEATLLQGMLKDVGVQLNIQTVPSTEFFDKYIDVGNFDLTLFSWVGTPFPISSGFSLYRNPQGSNHFQNSTFVGSQQIDDQMQKAIADLDQDQKIADINKADAMIWQIAGEIALNQRPDLVATKKNLANYGAFGFASTIWQDVGFTK